MDSIKDKAHLAQGLQERICLYHTCPNIQGCNFNQEQEQVLEQNTSKDSKHSRNEYVGSSKMLTRYIH